MSVHYREQLKKQLYLCVLVGHEVYILLQRCTKKCLVLSLRQRLRKNRRAVRRSVHFTTFLSRARSPKRGKHTLKPMIKTVKKYLVFYCVHGQLTNALMNNKHTSISNILKEMVSFCKDRICMLLVMVCF